MDGSESTDFPFTQGLIWSLIIHLALGITFLLKILIFPSTQEVYLPSLKVDLVALPDLTKNEMKNLTASGGRQSSKTKSRPIPKGEMILQNRKKRKSKIKNALSRIKSITKIQDDSAPDLIKGNILSKGSTLSGEAREAAEPTYFDTILEKIKISWTLPVWLARQKLSAQVVILINPNGNVTRIRFKRPSGSAQFDQTVIDAIKLASPFSPPPSDLRGTLQSSGILLGFPL